MYEEFLELIEKYKGHHNLNFSKFSDADIAAEESRYGRLPPSYLAFLRHCPTGSFFDGSFIIYDGPLSFEELSLEVRTAAEEGLIAFGDNHGGTILCFDINNPDANGEFPIVEYNYPNYRVQIATNFREWLMGIVCMYV